MVGCIVSEMVKKTTIVAIVLFCGGMAARADLILVTGATPGCEGSGCPGTAPSVSVGTSTGPTPFSFTINANGSNDPYLVTGTSYAAYSATTGTDFQVNINVAYSGTLATTATDNFVIDVYENFFNATPGTWNGTYYEASGATISSGLGGGSQFSMNVFYDGNGVGQLGPFTSSTGFASTSANLTGLTGPTLSGDFEFNYTFGIGTTHGASMAATPAVAPEPRETLPLLLVGLAGAWWYSRKIRKCL
jgi:hypothetical protein